MKITKKILPILLIACLVLSQGLFTFANEAGVQAVQTSPSPWALWDVQMASTYGLGDAQTYNHYTKTSTLTDFLMVQGSFEKKFDVVDTTKLTSSLVTRSEVIKELYDIIAPVLSLEAVTVTAEDSLAYFVNNGLITGRTDGNYALNAPCTKEEMLVFSKRVYDHIIYTQGKEAKGAFWQVSDDNNTVYLLGSIHVTDDSIYPLSKDILNAFVATKGLIVEANTLVVNPEDSVYIQQIMMLEGDVTIDTLLSEETYKAYVEKVATLGITPEVYNKLKPWYAGMLLQSTNMASASYSGAMGIDMYFQYLAYGHMPIMEVEGIKYQIDLFDSFSPALQEGFLLSALSGQEESNDMIAQMLAAWKSGDTKTLETLLFSEEEMTDIEKEFSEKLWNERNKHMTTYVESLLSDEANQDYFFVVGAGHMLNDNGIIAELIARGYKVERK